MKNVEKLVALLLSKKILISGAESCTGGLVAAALTSAPGVSEVFKESFVVYSNEAKVKNLGVKQETIEKFGVVSEECAREMAEGVAKKSGAGITFAITGIAGPSGGTLEKPVGTVCFGFFYGNETFATTLCFSGERDKIRKSACKAAVKMMLNLVKS